MNKPTPTVRAHTLALQGLVNHVVRAMLRAPLLCRLVGKRLIIVYVVGRKSGQHYTVPVAYTRHDGTLLVGTQFDEHGEPRPDISHGPPALESSF